MSKVKSKQVKEASGPPPNVLGKVKGAAITKAGQAARNTKQLAKVAAAKFDAKKRTKEPTPEESDSNSEVSESESEQSTSSEESASGSEEESDVEEAAATKPGKSGAKVNGTARAESESDEEDDSDDESVSSESSAEATLVNGDAGKTKGGVNGTTASSKAKDSESESESESKSETDEEEERAAPANEAPAGSSGSESEEESEDESEGDHQQKTTSVRKPAGEKVSELKAVSAPRPAKENTKDESDEDDESGSEASSEEDGDSESGEESDESEASAESEAEAKPATKAPAKRKAEEPPVPAAKKFKPETNGETAENTNLFVGNLSWNVDEDVLTQTFEVYGELAGVRLITDRDTGRSKGYGYIEFVHAADAAKAHAEKKGAELDGRPLNVDYANKRKSDGQGTREKFQARARSFGDSTSPPSETLFVGNLAFDVTQDIVSQAFGDYGTILGVRLPTDRESGQPKGFGYVTFASVEDAQAAFAAMQGARISGRPVRLDYSTPRPQTADSPRGRGGFAGRGRGGFNNRGGRGGARGGFSSRGGSTNRGGFGDFSGKKTTF